MNELVRVNENKHSLEKASGFSQKHIEILKNSICKDLSNEEFEVFLMACTKTQLDPFMRQIYAIKRKTKNSDGTWGEKMTIQTGVDGLRLIGERTGRYAPAQEPTFVYDNNGALISATAYIKKQTLDGTWHVISASAYMDEFCQTFVDKQTGQKRPTGLWTDKPRTMLAKCAESQALRKAFPAEMSGIYAKEEMMQAQEHEVISTSYPSKISESEAAFLDGLLTDCGDDYRQKIMRRLSMDKIYDLANIPESMYETVISAVQKYKADKQQEVVA